MSKTCKKSVHGNDKKNLPWGSKKCPGSLHFTLLIIVLLENKYYSQIDAVVMVSPSGLALTKILLCYY